MTKVMLIAGVAALAIAAPAAAGPHGGGHGHGGGRPAAHGGGGHAQAQARQNRGGGHAAAADRQSHGGGHRMQMAQPRRQQAQRMASADRGHARAQMQRKAQHQQAQRQAQHEQARHQQAQRQQVKHQQAQRQAEHQQARRQQVQRQAMQHQRDDQRRAHAIQQHQRDEQRQARNFQQQRARAVAQNRDADRRRFQADRRDQARERSDRQRRFDNDRRLAAQAFARNDFVQNFSRASDRRLIDGCPPGLAAKRNGCLPPGQAIRLLGSPVARAASYGRLAALPQPLRYMYPETPDYYYRYGDGYLYQVNRSNDVIDSLLPLIAGGYVPGMVFPTAYRNSYVPDYYGYDSFYQDTPYADYRYLDGNVYSLDPYSGTIEDVIPTYAYGYGVGQMLPAGYGYYNVPTQYRNVYYDTPDYSYRYAPGAIYQVDPSTQLITSVASLLAPGMTVGQALPVGYNTYNVPMAYRSTYYDTPNTWYRYNNGNIYQVDPTTQVVTAIVASLLT